MRFAAEPWDYLAEDEAIDHEHPLVQRIASEMRTGDDVAYARSAFEYVRDQVTHSMDVGDRRVTWRASDVLNEGTGLCYAKAHAFVALLRAGGIQSGLCYQRLRSGDDPRGDDPPTTPRSRPATSLALGVGSGSIFVLHGLAAALIDDRWVRLDPRGNKPGVDVRFSAIEDRLAYVPDPALGEIDYLTVHATPHPVVLNVLKAHDDCVAMCGAGHLPATLD
jgi:transglutaminase-like putative cysteine protease